MRAWIALAIACSLPATGLARSFDSALYARLLEKHTREVRDTAGTRVDYTELQGSADWKALVASLAGSDPKPLTDREQRLAFWINAYNILAIDLVVKNYPLPSIRDAGTLFRPVWKVEAGRVGGRGVSLHEIEHEILRPMGEPRIHAAIVCASVSCPALRREPFDAARLDAQLDDTLRSWLANRQKGLAIEPAAETVWLSQIFHWFEEDFEKSGGALAFVLRYAPEGERGWIERRGDDFRIRYLHYDWDLNDLAGAMPGG